MSETINLVDYHRWRKSQESGDASIVEPPGGLGSPPDALGRFCDPEAVLDLLTAYGVSLASREARGELAARLSREGHLPEIAALLAYYDEQNPTDPAKVGRLAGAAFREPDRGWRRQLADAARLAFEHSRRRGSPQRPLVENGGAVAAEEARRVAESSPGYQESRDYWWPYQRIVLDQVPAGLVAKEMHWSLDQTYAHVLAVIESNDRRLRDRRDGELDTEAKRRLSEERATASADMALRQAKLNLRCQLRRTMETFTDWKPPKALIDFVGGMKRLRCGEPNTPAAKIALLSVDDAIAAGQGRGSEALRPRRQEMAELQESVGT